MSRSEGEGEGERMRSFRSVGSTSEDERPGFWKRRLTFTYSDRCVPPQPRSGWEREQGRTRRSPAADSVPGTLVFLIACNSADRMRPIGGSRTD